MKVKQFAFFFLLFLSHAAVAQDTLSCKTDLTWDDATKRYHRKDDASKTPYTGPAKCYPSKDVENKGYLKNGAWDGKVTGYKNGKILGYCYFNEGLYHGFEVRYDYLGQLKDSSFYENDKRHYVYVVSRGKKGQLDYTSLYNDLTMEMVTSYYTSYENLVYVYDITRRKGKEKNGIEESFEITFQEDGTPVPYLSQKTTYANGKKHGKDILYDENGEIISETEFVNGKEKTTD